MKNLNGSSPVNPALAGEDEAAAGQPVLLPVAFPGGQVSPRGLVFGKAAVVWSHAGSSVHFPTPLPRDHRDPDERGWAARLPDTAPQAGTAPPARQQKRDPVHPWHLPHLPQDHKEAGQEG